MQPLRLLDLFSGIGGFSLGLERSGAFKTVAFCEIEPFCRRVLAKHWPDVPCYDDVRTLTADRLEADGIAVDAICGGFPCQDISFAGKGAGLAGERSGLWFEYARIVSELRPRFVIVENVGALLSRGLDAVLGTLAALGYDAEWHCIPASYVGAPHRRDRVWIVAHPKELYGDGGEHNRRRYCESSLSISKFGDSRRIEDVADSECGRLQSGHEQCPRPTAIIPTAFSRHRGGGEFGKAWRVEPDVGRVAYGIPDAVDRLKGLGNAVVPQVVELIGIAIGASLVDP